MTQYLINPELPEGFWNTPNEERSVAEIEAWWDVPYITTETADDVEAHTRKHYAWLKKNDPGLATDDVETRVENDRASFLARCPSGTRYTVDCLDGGAWDRPTWWGDFGTLEEAQKCCDKGPEWRRRMMQDLSEPEGD